MSEWMNELLVLVIVIAYFRLLWVLAFVAGQLLIFVVETLADYFERRQERKDAIKQAKAMQDRKRHERQRAFMQKRRQRELNSKY